MTPETLERIKALLKQLMNRKDSFYAQKFAGINVDALHGLEDFQNLPFTEKSDLRNAYPLGLCAVDPSQIIRVHSTSGTTGTPVIIPYTRKDVADWAEMFKRCYQIAGITCEDRLQITPGYGLWSAGIGFQAGAELLGAMVIPMGPGNTEKQLRFMEDMNVTVLCATSSYALLLTEEIARRDMRNRLSLKKGVIGSERWGDKMRQRISSELGIALYDIYGLTEVYGPGIAISCDAAAGMHYFDDYLYFEIIDPKTGKTLPDGELGELVITTLKKEGAPLIRYRTHDLTRILPGPCKCGCPYPRIDRILGRTDEMVKVKGVNIFPGQIDDLLKEIEGVSSEYQVFIDHVEGKDILTLKFETEALLQDRPTMERRVASHFKSRIGIAIRPQAVSLGELPRSEKKSVRMFDNR